MRKIVILAREAGYDARMEEVELMQDLPATCLHADSTETLFTELEKHEAQFLERVKRVHGSGNKLKYIAELNDGHITVGLQEINPDHIFYSLKGTDNMIAIYSDRYEQPLTIKGAGAGPENTAAGVLSDVLRIKFNL